MIEAPIPEEESARLKSLLELSLLDSGHEERFDRITRTAQALFGVKMSYVSLIDQSRQWFKSSCGLRSSETPRTISFCGHAIVGDDPMVVPDAYEDERFHDNPLVRGEPFVRFYAGRPLRSFRGYKVGTLCVADPNPRNLSSSEIRLLDDLGAMVEDQLNLMEISRLQLELQHAHEDLRKSHNFIRKVFGKYAGGTLVEQVLQSPDSISLGGVSRDISIMVSDLRGFTNLSEKIPAGQLVDVLNRYFEKMIEIIEANDGLILDFVGDGIFVAFGALPPYEDHAGRAMKCALAMQDALDRLRSTDPMIGGNNLQMGIGIHSGDAIVGNVGSLKRMKFGAVGANVNLAARIESFTVGGQILVSTNTLESAEATFSTDGRLRVSLKGIDKPFTIHELSREAGNFSAHQS